MKIRVLNGNSKGHGKLSKKWLFLLDAPFKISHKCCDKLKKDPFIQFEKMSKKNPIIGTMVEESRMRLFEYLKKGCNAFNEKKSSSTPIAFWTEKDIWDYIKKYDLDYSKIYDKGYKRTGCMYCTFGIISEKGINRFQRMEKTHPTLYKYIIYKLGLKRILDYIGVSYTTNFHILEEIVE